MAEVSKDLLLKLYIPFCQRQCGHCRLTVCGYDAPTLRAYGEAMLAELKAVAAEEAEGRVVTAVSIEGGCPGLMPSELLQILLREVRKSFTLADDVQIGVQTMPGDYSQTFIRRLRDNGVNFWSVGLATANLDEHNLLERPYRFDALTMVDTALKTFDMRELSFHLLYGIPGQTALSWERTLDKALAYSPEHLTLEPVGIGPGTRLYEKVKAGKLTPPPSEAATELYLLAKEKLEGLGYREYTAHRFALPGYEDRYQLGLLAGTDRLGIGYLADSCLDGLFYTNGHSLCEYMAHPTELEVIANQITRVE